MTNNDTELKPDEVRIDIIKGVEGLAIYINDYRICGPKPWGGGEIVKTWKSKLDDVLTAIGIKE